MSNNSLFRLRLPEKGHESPWDCIVDLIGGWDSCPLPVKSDKNRESPLYTVKNKKNGCLWSDEDCCINGLDGSCELFASWIVCNSSRQSVPLLYGSRIEWILVDLLGCCWLIYAVSTLVRLWLVRSMDPGLISTSPLWIWYNMVSLWVHHLSTKGSQPSSLSMWDTQPVVLSQ